LTEFQKAFPTLTSILFVINEKGNDTIGDFEVQPFYGRDHILEEMNAFNSEQKLLFKINIKLNFV
jgi:23S rRNA (uracil1939-C5)-methyltransferase